MLSLNWCPAVYYVCVLCTCIMYVTLRQVLYPDTTRFYRAQVRILTHSRVYSRLCVIVCVLAHAACYTLRSKRNWMRHVHAEIQMHTLYIYVCVCVYTYHIYIHTYPHACTYMYTDCPLTWGRYPEAGDAISVHQGIDLFPLSFSLPFSLPPSHPRSLSLGPLSIF